MTLEHLLLLVLAFSALCSCEADITAVCVLKGTENDPGITGTVLFTTEGASGKTLVSANIRGITANAGNTMAMHVHTYGDMTGNDGMTTAGHFVGMGADHHACPDTDNRHSGDMGNWRVNGGQIIESKMLDLLPLGGIHSILGRGVILHEKLDDCVSQPSGDAGLRLAQCVVGIQNVPGNGAFQPNVDDEPGICVFEGTANAPFLTGMAYFTRTQQGVEVLARIEGLESSSDHGFHIHEWGDMTSDDGTAAGGHYNPKGVWHRMPPQPISHAGDLGNIKYWDNEGVAWYHGVYDYLFETSGIESIFGRGMIIHETFDDGCSQPTGNAGGRLGQCVIGIKNPSTQVPAKPEPCCPPQGGTDCSNFPSTVSVE